jgi:hypothetical protein
MQVFTRGLCLPAQAPSLWASVGAKQEGNGRKDTPGSGKICSLIEGRQFASAKGGLSTREPPQLSEPPRILPGQAGHP